VLPHLAQNCAWFLRESSSNSYGSRMPQRQSKRCLPSLLKMHGHGSNTAKSCGIPTTGPIARSSAPEIFRGTIALCWGVAQQFLYDLDYEKAAKYHERLLNLHPSMWDNFVICRYYATCLKEIARTQEAADIIATALKSCRLAAECAKGEGLELIKREEARLLVQAGRFDESFATLQSIKGIAVSAPRYDRAEYLPRTPERLQRLAEIVASRDVFVLLQGPSFAMFASRLHEFAGFEFATATLNAFPPVEQELRRIDRYADILLFTRPGSIRSWHSELMEFLARSSPNLVVANRSLTSTTAGSISMLSMLSMVMVIELLTSLFVVLKPISGFKFHPYSMCAPTVPIESSRASILTTRVQG
jgi:hypothetical protein